MIAHSLSLTHTHKHTYIKLERERERNTQNFSSYHANTENQYACSHSTKERDGLVLKVLKKTHLNRHQQKGKTFVVEND